MVLKNKKVGLVVTPPGVIVETHEKITVDFLATNLGLNITFLLPNRRKGHKTPDIEMGGFHWEIKSPKGKSPRSIENNLRSALHQSPYIIIDLRRMDGLVPTKKYLIEIKRRFNDAKTMKHILVITRQGEIIDYAR